MVSAVVVAAAFASTALISLAPNLLLFLFPHASGASSHDWLSVGQALAAGGLLGDVFLHVIPHSAGMDQGGLWILLGFSIFLVVDMIVRSTSSSGHGHHHDRQHDDTNGNKEQHHLNLHQTHTSTVLLNLAADALHNFTDGIAIGASFAHAHVLTPATSVGSEFWRDFWTLLKSRGGIATLSILFHEIPHELGDYATLLKEGFSQQSAIAAQFMTAVAALIGTGAGLVVHDYAGDQLIFVTAGGFIYLACVTILPDVLDESTTNRKRPNSNGFRVAVVVAFGLGIAFLYVVSLLEELDESGHVHSHSHHSHGHDHHVTDKESRYDHHHSHHDIAHDHAVDHDHHDHDYHHHDHVNGEL